MKLKYKFVMNKVADKTVAIAVGEDLAKYNGFIKMNDTGAFIFKMLENDVTSKQIIDSLEAEYSASKEELSSAVEEFIKELMRVGVIE